MTTAGEDRVRLGHRILVKHQGRWMTERARDRLVAAAKPKAAPSKPAPAAVQPATAPAPVAKPAAPTPAPATAVDVDRSTAAEIAEVCAAAGAADLAAGFIRNGATVEFVRQQVDGIGTIRKACADARKINPDLPKAIDDSLIRGFQAGLVTVAMARDALLNELCDRQSPEIHSAIPSDLSGNPAARNHGWDRAVAKATGKAGAQ